MHSGDAEIRQSTVRRILPTGSTVKEVAECCVDMLNIEVVRYMVESTPEKDNLHYKLEQLGFSVGQRLAERYTKDRTLFSDTLEIIKFICKDFWTDVFHKQVDNLRTNHRGVYVLQDNRFRWITRLSGGKDIKETALDYAIFPCGIIRGFLANLNVQASVTAEITAMPTCSFTIHVKSK